MEENKPEIIAKIKMALGAVGKPNDDLDAEIIYNNMKSYADSNTVYETKIDGEWGRAEIYQSITGGYVGKLDINPNLSNVPNKLNNEIMHNNKIYIKLLKAGGYRSKDGTIKKPIFINGIPFAPKDDVK